VIGFRHGCIVWFKGELAASFLIRVPKRIHGTKTAITGEYCRHAVLDRVIFAIPAERVSPLVGDRAPSGIAIHASVAGAGVKTERGNQGGNGKCQFDGKDFHARQSTAATVRKANVVPASVPQNKCQPKTAKDAPKMPPWGALSNFLPLAMFSFCSSIKFEKHTTEY
jgi:hypothetical protein